ncbi:MAG: hypothetical protein OXC48_10270, partial [Endozoicomonadaceae bacterium]|nr:hypothetical protein [Endozoicomonadaceae bacterium]
KQRYFVSEDPAGDGYAFGNNNPVMNTDPSGNMPHWLGNTLQWAGYISTFGLGALHKKWANITAAVIGSGLCIVTLGASVLTGGSTAMSAALAGSALTSTLPIASAAVPANKGLGIAASVTGLADLAVNIAAGAALAFLGAAAEETAIEMKMMYRPKGAYQMFRVSNPVILPRDLVVRSIGSELKTYLLQNRLFDLIDKNNNLIIKDAKGIDIIWEWLITSKFHSLIVCDTEAILLTARINGKPLSLNLFSAFIDTCCCYESKISHVLTYQKSLDNILNSVADGSHTVIRKPLKHPYTLSEMVPDGEYIVIGGGGDRFDQSHLSHIGVLQKLNFAWKIYNLDGNGIKFCDIDCLDIIYREYFWSDTKNSPEIHFTLKLRDRFTEDVFI